MVHNRTRKRPIKTSDRQKRILRTRRLRSSTSSDSSISAANDDHSSSSKKNCNKNRSDVYKLRSNRTEEIKLNRKDSSEQSEQDDDKEEEELIEEKSFFVETPKLDESIRDFLWQPTKTSTSTTTITEVTDQSGVTVFIREINDMAASNINRPSRFLGYGSGGRGGKH